VAAFVTELNFQLVPSERSSLILCVCLSKLSCAAFNHACNWKAAGTYGESIGNAAWDPTCLCPLSSVGGLCLMAYEPHNAIR
jgi:hypothetical protein